MGERATPLNLGRVDLWLQCIFILNCGMLPTVIFCHGNETTLNFFKIVLSFCRILVLFYSISVPGSR